MNKYIRQKRTPLPAWEDKIAMALSFDGRDDLVFHQDEMQIRVIIWHCHINMFGSPFPKDYVALNMIKGIYQGRHLIKTPYGEICPRCRVNEYIVKQKTSLLPASMQKLYDMNGSMCLRCGALTGTD
jgi:hypothetical protein